MLPVRLALCDLEAPGGSLGFRIVHLLLPGSQIIVWHFVVCCFALFFTLPYQSLRWYNVIISSCIFQLFMNWSADTYRAGFCFVFVCGLCVLFCLVFLSVLFVFSFWCLFFVLHGDSSMDYVSIQFSSLWFHIVIMTDVATALIRWICTMQLSFRLDKRPGESHLALDGKKRLPPRPTVGSVVFLVFCGGWGFFVVSVFGSSRIGRCQSTSRHGTCRCYAQPARWCTDTQFRAAHCLSPTVATAVQLT